MQTVQRAILLALDEESRLISTNTANRLRRYLLADEQPYPESIWREIWLAAEDSVPPSDTEEATAPLILESEPQDVLRDAIQRVIQDEIRNVASDRDLRGTRALDPQDRIVFYIIASLGSTSAQAAIWNALSALHSLPEGRGNSDVVGLFLLPGSTAQLEREALLQARATAYATLQLIDSIVQETEGTPWHDWFPFDRMWIVGSQDERGRGLGGPDGLKDLISEGLCSMIAENVLEKSRRGKGADEREMLDYFGNPRCFSSFGFCQLDFPKQQLRDMLLEQTKSRLYQDVLLRNSKIDLSKVVIEARSFLAKKMRLAGLDRARTEAADELEPAGLEQWVAEDLETHALLIQEFSFADPLKGTVSQLDVSLRQAVKLFEENELASAKLKLISNADRIHAQLTDVAHSQLREWVDEPTRGPIQAIAFGEEMQGSSQNETTEERRPLPFYEEEIRRRLEAVTGIDVDVAEGMELSHDIAETEALVRSLNEEIRGVTESLDQGNATLENQLDQEEEEPLDEDVIALGEEDLEASEPDEEGEDEDDESGKIVSQEPMPAQDEVIASFPNDEGAGRVAIQEHLAALSGRLEQANERLQRLLHRKADLDEARSLRERLWDSTDERGKVFRELDAKERVAIAEEMQALYVLEKNAAEVKRTEESIRDRSSRELIRIGLIIPGVLMICFTLAVVLANKVGGIPWWTVFGQDGQVIQRGIFDSLGAYPEWYIIGIAAYCAFAMWEYARRIFIPLVEARREHKDLVRQGESNRELIIGRWRELFRRHLRLRVLDHSFAILRRLKESIEADCTTIRSFLDSVRESQERLPEETFSDKAGATYVISHADLSYFEELCFGTDVNEALRPVFDEELGGRRVSSLLWTSEHAIGDVEEAVENFFEVRFDNVVGRISIEELVTDHWQRIHPEVSPERRAEEIFDLATFVQIQAPAGEPSVVSTYEVGIASGGDSTFARHFGGIPFTYNVFACSSWEKILVYCLSSPFSVSYVAELRNLQHAYDSVKEEERKGLISKQVPRRKLRSLARDDELA